VKPKPNHIAPKKVLVTNAKSRIAYNIVRSLGKKKIPVYTADFIRNAMSFRSKYSCGHFLYASPFGPEEKFIASLVDILASAKIDVLIPVYEETFLISKYKQEIEKYTNLIIPSYEQILIAHNKNQWSAIAEKEGIRTPLTYEAVDLIDRRHSFAAQEYPLIIKPKQGGGGWGIEQIDSQDELETYFKNRPAKTWCPERYIIQRKIVGSTFCVAMLFNKGACKARITYQQLREFPNERGQATLRISNEHKEAESALRKLLERLNWHGICQADFVVEKETSRAYLVDVNPRLWGSLAQGIAAGVDFPYLIYKMCINGDTETVDSFLPGIKSRWIGGDIKAVWYDLKDNPNRVRKIREFLSDFGGDVYFDDLQFSDPLPFIFWCYDIGCRILKNRSFNIAPHETLSGIWT